MEDKNKRKSEQPQKEIDISLNLSGESTKRKIKKWPFIVAAVVAILALAVVLLWNPISKLLNKEEHKTVHDLEREALTQLIDGFIDCYDSIVSSEQSDPVGAKYHMEFEIDSIALMFIKKQYPELSALEILNEVSVDACFENDGERVRLSVAPVHQEADLPEGELILDLQTKLLYVAAESLTDEYLEFDLSQISAAADYLAIAGQLPEPEALEKILKDYLESLLALMVLKAESNELVSVGDIEQTCTVYSMELNARDFMELNIDVLNELSELCGEDTQLGGLFEMAKTEAETSMENIKEDDVILWTDFVDDQSRIIGREVKKNAEEDGLYYLCVRNNEQLALKCTFDTIEFSGTGTCKENKLDGTFMLLADGIKYLEIRPDDIDLKELENGEIEGTVQFVLSDELAEMLLGSVPGLPMEFDVEFNITEDACKFVINYMDLASVSFYVTEYVPEKIDLPTGTAIDGSDTDALNRWLQSIDIEKIKQELEKIGISLSDYI